VKNYFGEKEDIFKQRISKYCEYTVEIPTARINNDEG